MRVVETGEISFTCCAKDSRYLHWTRIPTPYVGSVSFSESLGTGLPQENFRLGLIEQMPFASDSFDIVICNAVLHFARDETQFRSMLCELWRVLKPGGMLFARLGSRIGMDFPRSRDNVFRMGDGSEWFLVDQEMLLDLTGELNGVLVDPLKTTIVQDSRCMTTWVLRKRRPPSAQSK